MQTLPSLRSHKSRPKCSRWLAQKRKAGGPFRFIPAEVCTQPLLSTLHRIHGLHHSRDGSYVAFAYNKDRGPSYTCQDKSLDSTTNIYLCVLVAFAHMPIKLPEKLRTNCTLYAILPLSSGTAKLILLKSSV